MFRFFDADALLASCSSFGTGDGANLRRLDDPDELGSKLLACATEYFLFSFDLVSDARTVAYFFAEVVLYFSSSAAP